MFCPVHVRRRVYHSERNEQASPVRFIQSWVMPRSYGQQPVYGGLADSRERQAARHNSFEHLVGDRDDANCKAPVLINQDAHFHLAEIEKDATATFPLKSGRQCYILQIEGSVDLLEETLEQADAATVAGGKALDLEFRAKTKALVLIVEMAAGK